MKINNSIFKFILKLLVTALLLGWFLYRTDIGRVFQNLLNLSLSLFILANLLNISAIFMNTVKWHYLLPQYPYMKLLKLNFIGQYYALLLPGQLAGEVVKAYILGKGQKDAEQVAASVLVDKITGILGLFLIGIFGLFLTGQNLPEGLVWSLVAGIGIGIGALFSIRFNYVYSASLKIVDFFNARFPRINKLWGQLKKLIEAWHGYSKRLSLICFSVLMGAGYQLISVIIIILLANTLQINLSFIDWCWILGILSIILLLPITIGGLGLREGTLVGILGLLKVSSEKALALSFALFSLSIILAIIGGVIHFMIGLKKR